MPNPETTAVLSRPDGAAGRAASSHADLSPTQILFQGIGDGERVQPTTPIHRVLGEPVLPTYVKKIVLRTVDAVATQPPKVITETKISLDKNAGHPAIRTRVSDRGTMAEIAQRRTTSDSRMPADIEDRAETGVRVVGLQVADAINRENGHGPKGSLRVRIEARAAEITEIMVLAMLTAPATQRAIETKSMAVADPEVQAAQDAATIGTTYVTQEIPFDPEEDPLQRATRIARSSRYNDWDALQPPTASEEGYLPLARRIRPNPAGFVSGLDGFEEVGSYQKPIAS